MGLELAVLEGIEELGRRVGDDYQVWREEVGKQRKDR